LSEEASSWFYNTVQSPSREKREWLFEEAVVGLFRRFIHRDNHLIAAQQFERLKFDAAKGGVAALYERLLYISERMWEKPTRFQMRTKFIEALPESYEHVLTVVNGLSVKYNSLSELYQAALDIEQNTKALQMRRRAREAGSGGGGGQGSASRSTSDNKPTKSTSTNTRRTALHRRPDPAVSDRKTSDRPKMANQERPRPTSGPSNRIPSKPAPNKAAVKCFSCGQIGHYASDPICPNAGKKPSGGQRMFAQRVLDDTSDDEHHRQVAPVEDDGVPGDEPIESANPETSEEVNPG
ncbi:hypothetical protein OH77DRAFT_783213, partial [Trametes cingulata]